MRCLPIVAALFLLLGPMGLASDTISAAPLRFGPPVPRFALLGEWQLGTENSLTIALDGEGKCRVSLSDGAAVTLGADEYVYELAFDRDRFVSVLQVVHFDRSWPGMRHAGLLVVIDKIVAETDVSTIRRRLTLAHLANINSAERKVRVLGRLNHYPTIEVLMTTDPIPAPGERREPVSYLWEEWDLDQEVLVRSIEFTEGEANRAAAIRDGSLILGH